MIKQENIEIIDFKNMYELEKEINSAFKYMNTEDDSSIVLIANKDMTRKLMSHYSHYTYQIITFDPIDYNLPYCISLTKDHEFWCEPLWREGFNSRPDGYLDIWDTVVFVDSECTNDVLDSIKLKAKVVVFDILDENE